MATDLIPVANAHGFSPDICSYLTSDIGSYLKGESPINKMKLPGPPKADVLVYNTNQCRDVKDWFEFYAREWNVPCIGVHTPRSIGDVNDIIITAIAKQIEALIPTLEEVSGSKFDMEKLKEIIALSKTCTDTMERGFGCSSECSFTYHILRWYNTDGTGGRSSRHTGSNRLL